MEDGGYELACPPLRAVLSIMAYGDFEGKTIADPEVRKLFTRGFLLSSDWYRRRLAAKKQRDIEFWQAFQQRLQHSLAQEGDGGFVDQLDLHGRLAYAQQQLQIVQADEYEESLVGTLGVDPMRPSMKDKLLIDRLAGV
jgi:hypothetical protein